MTDPNSKFTLEMIQELIECCQPEHEAIKLAMELYKKEWLSDRAPVWPPKDPRFYIFQNNNRDIIDFESQFGTFGHIKMVTGWYAWITGFDYATAKEKGMIQ